MTRDKRSTDNQHEVALVVRCLVRLRHHQGESSVEQAVEEAARLDWQFCESCGSEEPHEGDLCTGCGLKPIISKTSVLIITTQNHGDDHEQRTSRGPDE